MKSNISAAQDGRTEKILSAVRNYEGAGLMSRRDFLALRKGQGWTVEAAQVRQWAVEEKERSWLSDNSFKHPFGNPQHPLTEAYNTRKKTLAAGIYKTEYRLNAPDDRSFHTITKTEYDFFQNL